jgi:DNA-binding response OmpR family regulator
MPDHKVLIVDDDQDLAYALSIRLRAAGYKAVFAPDAISAGQQVRKEAPDVILLDVGLPGGDGFLVMDRLRKFGAVGVIPTIIVSAQDPIPTRAKALAAGAFAYFKKPADPTDLLNAVRKALDGQRSMLGTRESVT